MAGVVDAKTDDVNWNWREGEEGEGGLSWKWHFKSKIIQIEAQSVLGTWRNYGMGATFQVYLDHCSIHGKMLVDLLHFGAFQKLFTTTKN